MPVTVTAEASASQCSRCQWHTPTVTRSQTPRRSHGPPSRSLRVTVRVGGLAFPGPRRPAGREPESDSDSTLGAACQWPGPGACHCQWHAVGRGSLARRRATKWPRRWGSESSLPLPASGGHRLSLGLRGCHWHSSSRPWAGPRAPGRRGRRAPASVPGRVCVAAARSTRHWQRPRRAPAIAASSLSAPSSIRRRRPR